MNQALTKTSTMPDATAHPTTVLSVNMEQESIRQQADKSLVIDM